LEVVLPLALTSIYNFSSQNEKQIFSQLYNLFAFIQQILKTNIYRFAHNIQDKINKHDSLKVNVHFVQGYLWQPSTWGSELINSQISAALEKWYEFFPV